MAILIRKSNFFIKAQKDSLEHNSKRNVTYRIDYKNCNASYIGLVERVLGLRNTIMTLTKKIGNLSVISKHRLQFEHEFDFDNSKILDNERYLGKRLVSEMLHIKLQENRKYLNAQNDTEFLPCLFLQTFLTSYEITLLFH